MEAKSNPMPTSVPMCADKKEATRLRAMNPKITDKRLSKNCRIFVLLNPQKQRLNITTPLMVHYTPTMVKM